MAQHAKPFPPPDPLRPEKSADEIACEQGIHGPQDLDALGALMPAEFDPDAFDVWLVETRAERRAAAQQKR